MNLPNKLTLTRIVLVPVFAQVFVFMLLPIFGTAAISFMEYNPLQTANRFIAQGVRRADQLRRLVEYRQAAQERGPRRVQTIEHLAILDAIEQHQLSKAAELMRVHLEGARRIKVFADGVFGSARTHSPG